MKRKKCGTIFSPFPRPDQARMAGCVQGKFMAASSPSCQLQSSFSICQVISIIDRYNMPNTRTYCTRIKWEKTSLLFHWKVVFCFIEREENGSLQITLWNINRLIERWENYNLSSFIWRFTILRSNKSSLRMWWNWCLSGIDSDQPDIGHFCKWAE